jgi:hypothetical protein
VNTTIISAFNRKTRRLVGAEFAAVDAVHEPLRVIHILMEGLAPEAAGGFWFVDFQGIPVARARSPYGLVYLDESHHVLQAVEISPDSMFAQCPGEPASALVVLPGAIAASQTKAGDQLALDLVKRTTAKFAPATVPQSVPVDPKVSRVVSIGDAPGFKGPAETAQPALPSGSLLKGAASSVPQPVASGTKTVAETVLAVRQEQIAAEEAKPARSVAMVLVAEPRVEVEAAAPDSLAKSPSATPSAARAAANGDLAQRKATPVEGASVAGLAQLPLSQSEDEPKVRAPEQSLPTQLVLPWKVWLLYFIFPKLDPANRSAIDTARADYWKAKKKRRNKPALYIRVLSWFYPELHLETLEERRREQRRSPRVAAPGLVGYHFTGGAAKPHEIRNLSVAGFFMQTDERWPIGTIVRLNMQRIGRDEDEPDAAFAVHCKVVSECEGGVGFEFVMPGLFS